MITSSLGAFCSSGKIIHFVTYIIDKSCYHIIMDEKRTSDFLNLILKNQSRIYSYILGQVCNYHDADDVLQETTKVLWQKFDEFESGTDFLAWAIAVARNEVLSYIKKKRRLNARVVFDDDVIELMQPNAEKFNDNYEQKIDAVRNCVSKLSDRDVQLIKLRYYEKVKPKDLSDRLGLTIHNTYKRMSRIHARLLKCIEISIQGI